MAGGELYFGDNLGVLREHVSDESVDLVYLDPPFNSQQNYNVLFEEHDHTDSEAQIQAFEDYWQWDVLAEKTYRELTDEGAEERGVPARLVTLIEALHNFLGRNDMLAYIVMMAVRLVELRRALKPTGSLYLHCDPTASHYIKLVLDAVFGPEGFQNEIIWQRTTAKSLMKRRLPSNHDVIFAYNKTDEYTWNLAATFQPYDPDHLDAKTDAKYASRDPDGRRYTLGDLTNPNADRPNLAYEFLGHRKVWRWTKDRMTEAYQKGLVIQPSPGAVPREKRYLDERLGKPLGDVWTDIPPLNSQAAERLGYPTQKPLALMERILNAATSEGDVVLDPFCGCGTTIDAAQRLARNWIGIDITHLAIALIRNRLDTAFPGITYKVIGEPVDVASARVLAESDPYQFQWWALHLIGARPVGEVKGKVGKKGRDRGIDGVIRFRDDPTASASERILVSVKAGANIGPAMVRDLRGTMDRDGAPIGVLFTMEEPSAEMRTEAIKAGTWRSTTWNKEYPRIQLITVEQAFGGKRVEFPGRDTTLQAALTHHPEHEALVLPGVAPSAAPSRRARRTSRGVAPRAVPVAPAPVLFAAEAEALPGEPVKRGGKRRRVK